MLICVDMCIPYRVLYGGSIWRTMEGGFRISEIGWEDFRFGEMKCGELGRNETD